MHAVYSLCTSEEGEGGCTQAMIIRVRLERDYDAMYSVGTRIFISSISRQVTRILGSISRRVTKILGSMSRHKLNQIRTQIQTQTYSIWVLSNPQCFSSKMFHVNTLSITKHILEKSKTDKTSFNVTDNISFQKDNHTQDKVLSPAVKPILYNSVQKYNTMRLMYLYLTISIEIVNFMSPAITFIMKFLV